MSALSPGYNLTNSAVIGTEPPIETGARRRSPEDWHRISLRWLAGTILAGLAGSALIGAAVYTALDRQANFAEMPVIVQPVHKDTGTGANVRKGDRLVRPIDIVAAKQTYQATIPVKVGDKEVLTSRTFTHVSTPLTLTSTPFADDVPTFDPLKLLTGSKENSETAQDQTPTIDAAEVALTNRDLNDQDLFSTNVGLSEEEVQAQISEQLKNAAAAGAKTVLPLPAQLLLMRTSRAGINIGPATLGNSPFSPIVPKTISDTAFSSIAVRMVPENVSLIPRSETTPNNPTQMEERLVVVRKGEALEDILKANQVSKAQIKLAVAAANQKRGGAIHEGQKLKLLFADLEGDGKAMSLARVTVYNDETPESMLAISDDGQFVQVKIDNGPAKTAASPAADNGDGEEDTDTGGMRLYNALYETALKQELPRNVVDDLTVIFANSVDFQRAVTAGDSFEVLYSDEPETKGELLYAAITARNETFKFYRFQSPDDNSVDYYDENGQSGRKFLIRKPIAAGVEKSGFGMRRHPIFGYMKMHTGVDWAAPTGTPIFAAGNGVILKAGWSSGYGRRVEIQHSGGYVSTYNHMSGFGRNISEGNSVKQGQIVGYVGTTGNVTGAHLHYEVIINGRFVDPMGIRLPRTRELDGKILAAFKQEKQRDEDILSKAPNATDLAARKP